MAASLRWAPPGPARAAAEANGSGFNLPLRLPATRGGVCRAVPSRRGEGLKGGLLSLAVLLVSAAPGFGGAPPLCSGSSACTEAVREARAGRRAAPACWGQW